MQSATVSQPGNQMIIVAEGSPHAPYPVGPGVPDPWRYHQTVGMRVFFHLSTKHSCCTALSRLYLSEPHCWFCLLSFPTSGLFFRSATVLCNLRRTRHRLAEAQPLPPALSPTHAVSSLHDGSRRTVSCRSTTDTRARTEDGTETAGNCNCGSEQRTAEQNFFRCRRQDTKRSNRTGSCLRKFSPSKR